MVFRRSVGKITDRQLEYINILSSYESSKGIDSRIIASFLEKCGKEEIKELSKKEASDLIQELLKIPVEYEFPCGIKKLINKQDYNTYSVLGPLEACLHDCPKNLDVYDCDVWIKKEEEVLEDEEELPLPTGRKPFEKCAVCGGFYFDHFTRSLAEQFRQNVEAFEAFIEFVKNPNKAKVVKKLVNHHISYEKNITIPVCPSCHRKIHTSKDHPFKPKDSRNNLNKKNKKQKRGSRVE